MPTMEQTPASSPACPSARQSAATLGAPQAVVAGLQSPPPSRLCRFIATCPTYNDSLVPYFLKGHGALGCVGSTDRHRQTHCKSFACMLLAAFLSRTTPGQAQDLAPLRA